MILFQKDVVRTKFDIYVFIYYCFYLSLDLMGCVFDALSCHYIFLLILAPQDNEVFVKPGCAQVRALVYCCSSLYLNI